MVCEWSTQVQLKPLKWASPSPDAAPPAPPSPSRPAGAVPPLQSPPEPSSSSTAAAPLVLSELLLVLKWGGVLTHAGRTQAEELGKLFRATMYPRYKLDDVHTFHHAPRVRES